MQDVIHGDCVEVMRGMEPESFDAIVTDPPYGLTANKRGIARQRIAAQYEVTLL